ncbi:M14 family metallopeptidase [Sunxiuqinia sp. A32]|uniref:M14 family metallopeptidase n=1 Tax=Sunxiuqinia sp. A32 TaxID=3461496 RepID=UPI00404660C0
MKKYLYICLIAGFLYGPVMAQDSYPTNKEITNRLQTLALNSSVTLNSLTKTVGGNDIWVLKIGVGDLDNKPGVAVVGGVEGYHLLSVELALQFAERLLNEHSEVLDSTTFYVFPNVSPDAYNQYFAPIKYERRGNAVGKDQDRDGAISEDPYDDLNKDGYISLMRVENPIGDYKADPMNPDLLVKVDHAKGEQGNYMAYTEGLDNDKDGQFNEDLEEGIAFNKNFTYKFPVFKPLADDYPVSQLETRAIVDYLFDQWNIFAFVTFSPANNLSEPLKFNDNDAKKKVVASMLEKDVAINKMVSDIYNEAITQKAFQQSNHGTDGDFFQWAYFHFGRLSFSTPGWWVPEVNREKSEENSNEEEKEKGETTKESNFIKWAEKEGLDDVFIPWTKISHPDFPDQIVEIGGIKPFAMTNPPYSMVDNIAIQHTDFILRLAAMHPNLEFHHSKIEKLDGGLTRITVDLVNNSSLPTHSEMGKRSRWLRKIRVDINKDKEEVLAGNTINLIDKLDAYESKTLSWIVKGSGNLEIKAGAAHTGFATLKIKL